MPAKTINLIPQSDFDQTPIGKILRWALTYGRYIIISTEIIVLLAFISRFSLDRKITDLNDEIEQKSAIIKANQGFERQFRNLQKRTNEIGTVLSNQQDIVGILNHFAQITPPGITFKNFSLSNGSITINALAQSENDMAVWIKELKTSPKLSDVSIGTISKSLVGGGEIDFTVNAKVR